VWQWLQLRSKEALCACSVAPNREGNRTRHNRRRDECVGPCRSIEMLGVSIGIASLAGMVSLGVSLQDQWRASL
jgi:hypothetical protein